MVETNLEGRVVFLERQLGVPDPAATEEVQRQREQQRAEYVKRAKELKAELKANMAADLEDDRQIEAHLRAAAAAIGRRLDRAKVNARLCHELTTKAAPVNVGVTEVARRTAYWISAIFATIPDHQHRLGFLQWMPGPYRADQSLVQISSRLIDNHVTPIIEE